jgi:hypothetical protein
VGLAQSAVSSTRHFDAAEGRTEADVHGVRGTAFLLSATSMLTVEHVAAAMHLSEQAWTEIDISDGERG